MAINSRTALIFSSDIRAFNALRPVQSCLMEFSVYYELINLFLLTYNTDTDGLIAPFTPSHGTESFNATSIMCRVLFVRFERHTLPTVKFQDNLTGLDLIFCPEFFEDWVFHGLADWTDVFEKEQLSNVVENLPLDFASWALPQSPLSRTYAKPANVRLTRIC